MSNPRDVLDRPASAPDVTLRYGPLPEHLIDVRWPTGRLARPAEAAVPAGATLVIVVHGGFWRHEFDRAHTGPQCEGLAAAGYAVATIEYRRSGMDGGGWPGTLDDVAAAIEAAPALVADAARAGGVAVDTDRTVLLGHSAGGHLVGWAATRATTPAVAAVSLAGVLDLALAAELGLDPGQSGSAHPALAAELGLDPGQSGSAVEALLGGRPGDVPDRYAAADPSRLGPPLLPVTALHGTQDDVVPIELGRSYAERTGQELVVLPGADHFGLIDPVSAAWPVVLRHLAAASGRTGR